MKHLITKVFLALGLIAGSSAVASAQTSDGSVEVANWTESFEGITYSSTSLTLPDGWSRLAWTGERTTHYNYTGYTAPKGCNPATLKDTSGASKCLINEKGQHLRIGSTDQWEDIYDYIITPQVKGNVKFYAKCYSTYLSTDGKSDTRAVIELYKMTKNADGSFSCNPATDQLEAYTYANGKLLPNTTDWIEINYNAGNEYQYIGFRISYAYVDEMTFENVLFPPKKVLTVSWGSLSSTTLRADADNKVTVSVNATVKNDGNVPLSKESEGEKYVLQLGAYYNSNVQSIFTTKDIPTLQPGESQTVTVSGEYILPADLPLSSSGYVNGFNVACLEPYNNDKRTNKSATLYPYKPIIGLQWTKNSSATATSKTTVGTDEIFFGVTQSSLEKTFFLNNTGAAPLNVIAATLPEGFSLSDIDFPCQVEAGGSKEFKVVLSSATPGFKSGKITFDTDAIAGTSTISVSGETVGADQFFADFENADDLSVWYAPVGSTSWKIADYTTTSSANERTTSSNPYWPEYKINDKKLTTTQGTSAPHALYSPLMRFNEGDKISFYAAKRANSSCELTVSYSTDRKEWKQLGKITVAANSANPDLQFKYTSQATSSGQYLYKRFELPIPEAGEYYISLSAGNVNVDNFVGGTLVEVPYDIVAETATIDKKGTVNHPVAYSATFKNIKSDAVQADGQTITLFANGKAVATSQPQAIDAGKTATFNFEFTPHMTGETPVYAQLKIEDYTVESEILNITINEEDGTSNLVVGNKNEGATRNNYPIQLNNKFSTSEVVYFPSQLEDLETNKIVKVSYFLWNNQAYEVDKIKIWMMNDDSDVIPTKYEEKTDLSTMTLVGEYDNFHLDKLGSGSDLYELVFDLNNGGFEYEPGKNLRIVMESFNANGSYANNFAVDTKTDPSHKSFRFYATTEANYNEGNGTAGSDALFPVISFYTQKDLLPTSGTVKDRRGNAIEGATVKAESGDVYYEAVTGEDGSWSMTIFQPEREYIVTASAEGYPVSEPAALNLTGDNDIILGAEEAPSLSFDDVEMEVTSNTTTAVTETVDVALNADTPFKYQGFQFDVTLPEGVKVESASSTLTSNITVGEVKDKDNTYRVLAYLGSNEGTEQTGAIATLTLSTTWDADTEYPVEGTMSIVEPIVFSTVTGDDITGIEGYTGNLTITLKATPAEEIVIGDVILMEPSSSASTDDIDNITAGESLNIDLTLKPGNTTTSTEDIVWSSEDVEGLEFSYDDEGNLIVNTDGVEIDAPKVVTITGEVDGVSASYTFTINPVVLGDSNDSGIVNVADVVTTSNYMNSKSVTRFDFPNANVILNEFEGKQVINTSDLTATIDIAFGDTDVNRRPARRHVSVSNTNDRLVADNFKAVQGRETVIGVSLDNTVGYAALHAEVIIPEGMKVYGVTKGERAAAHELDYNITDGRVYVTLYSLSNASFIEGEGKLFNLVVVADENCDNLGFDNINAADAASNGFYLYGEGGRNLTGTTDIDGIDADEEGVRYFDLNGIEIPRPDKGIYIRVNANGEAVKVVK